jgi:Tfp pilus assembly protein PilF/peroxiredoxin
MIYRDKRTRRFLAGLAVVLLGLLAVVSSRGVTQLKQSMEAPGFKLKDTAGTEVALADLKGKIVVVIFGELYHDKTVDGCRQIETVLKDERLRGVEIVPLLITAQEAKAEDFKLEAAGKVSMMVLRDTERKAFGDYQVTAMPSVVVVDKEGKVVSAVAGLIPQFSDIVSDSLMLAAGKLSNEQFLKARAPQFQAAPDDTVVRAQRIALLAKQLGLRGMDDLAVEKFNEALKLDPHQLDGRVDYGNLLLKRQRLAEAEAQFRAALAVQANSLPATLGLAFVQAQRGGPELDAAEKTVRDILMKNPTQARAHYLLGTILQTRGKMDDAAASFKKAAQLLLEQSQEESLP